MTTTGKAGGEEQPRKDGSGQKGSSCQGLWPLLAALERTVSMTLSRLCSEVLSQPGWGAGRALSSPLRLHGL